MSRAPDVAPAGDAPVAVPTGNTFDKYGSTNPVVRRLMAGFEGDAGPSCSTRAAPESVLDVGCGEGVLTYQWAEQLGDRPVVGIDLADPKLEAEWATPPAAEPRVPRDAPPRICRSRTARSTWPPRSRCSSTSPTPSARWPRWRAWPRGTCSSRCPREPLWRALNVARGAYVRELGNTPGTSTTGPSGASSALPAATARWSRRARRSRGRCCWCGCPDGERGVRGDRRPPRAAERTSNGAQPDAEAKPSYASGARVLSIGIASTGHLHVPLPGHRQPRARAGVLQPDLAVLGDHVRDPVGDLPAGRAAALADDRRPPGARAARPSAADPGADPVRLRACCS